MDDTNLNNNDNLTPYKASGNLNTFIDNPSMDVNDPMNMNIQNVTTDSSSLNVNDDFLNNYNGNNTVLNNLNSVPILNIDTLQESNEVNSNTSSNNDVVSNNFIDKNYIANKKAKKKKVTINFIPEFKIVLLIIVIFLVFIFVLPLISSLFND